MELVLVARIGVYERCSMQLENILSLMPKFSVAASMIISEEPMFSVLMKESNLNFCISSSISGLFNLAACLARCFSTNDLDVAS
eukprot:snap_masked-scaffold_10-processed-gene-11.14-mRNA-1 protein AED:1.00 eAED:1.00 QI:0/-1/0/0/-1/1/1/0/83